MENLHSVPLNTIYKISGTNLPKEVTEQLSRLGLIVGSQISILQRDKQNSIILLKNSRIVLASSILQQVFGEPGTTAENWLPLDQLAVGERCVVISVHGTGKIRRRLMDMGLTKNTAIEIRKLAPLGDPIEVHLRGYQLTLRKEEASLILVKKEEVE